MIEERETGAGVAPAHPTLALRQAMEHLARQERPRILDLGPASGSNIAYFARWRSRLFVEDLRDALAAPHGTAGALRALLCAADPSLPFDLILAWDLLNYLDIAAVEGLARRLGAFCRPGSLLFALIGTRREMPARPLRLAIADTATLLYEAETGALRPCPRYREPDLLRALPGFDVEASYLLRNGMQEYLFGFTG